MSSGGMAAFISPNPTSSKPPCSYLATAEVKSAMMSTLIVFTTGLGDPHQPSTALNSSDCFGVRALILYGPVPTRVSGLVHQVSAPPAVTAFSLTTPVTAAANTTPREP